MISTQAMSKRDKFVLDSGMELIWFLEDAYEHKDINKFSSLVSSDFRKDFLKLKRQLEKRFNESEQLSLYIHLVAKRQDLHIGISTYGICWSKRIKKQKDNYWHRDFGKAIIVFKRYCNNKDYNFLLYDISGQNPFS